MAIIKNPLTLVKQESGQTQGEYFAIVVDYDGTVLKEERLNTGDTFILPDTPNHERLTFDQWTSSEALTETIVGGKTQYSVTISDNNFMAGPTYYTKSGYNEFDIELNITTGLTFECWCDNGSTIDWGDETIEVATSRAYKTHTYQDYGKYIIKYNGLIQEYMFNNRANPTMDKIGRTFAVTDVKIKNGTIIFPTSCFSYDSKIKTITLPSSITSMSTSTLSNCVNLKCFIYPPNVLQPSKIGAQKSMKYIVLSYKMTNVISQLYYRVAFDKVVIPKAIPLASNMVNVYNLDEIVIANNTTALPTNFFAQSYALKKIKLSNNITNFSVSCFTNCQSLQEIPWTPNITTIGNSAFSYCTGLKNIVIPDTVTTIGTAAFSDCESLVTATVSSNVTAIPNSLFATCRYIQEIILKGDIVSVGTYAFAYTTGPTIQFLNCTQVPTLANANAFPTKCHILVPAALYNDWIVATNWSSLTDRIIAV